MVLPVSSHLPWSSPCAPRLDFPNLLFSEQFSYDTAEFTLCYGLHDCSPSFEDFIHPLSTLHYCNAPDLATRLTGDYRGRTYTDRHGPASLDTRTQKRIPCFQEILFEYYLLFGRKLVVGFVLKPLQPIILLVLFIQRLHRRELYAGILDIPPSGSVELRNLCF